jgi:hypothetical protein
MIKQIGKICYYSFLLLLIGCRSQQALTTQPVSMHANQQAFWQALQQHCGKAYEGQVIAAPANDTVFKNKTLLMHVKACSDDRIRIPFVVGADRSRTWVITRHASGLLLKHDHRHSDGKPDSVTMYGGYTTNSGMANMQIFPADRETTDLLPAAGGNVWWIEFVPNSHFTYNLRRLGTDRLFSIRFDLASTVPPPESPWGWID